jgi:ABC-type multidrug transport system fused ATPase/permease subunit
LCTNERPSLLGQEPEVPLFVEAKNLIYEVPTKPTKTHPENKKRLLHNVNAYFTPGELVAIMGPTGAGKRFDSPLHFGDYCFVF